MKTKITIVLLMFFLPSMIGSCKKDSVSNPPPLNEIVFNPDLTYETMTDTYGNEYKTITIGTQTWMAENLRSTKYNDGTAIPLITKDIDWGNLTTPGYCWYDNDSATYKTKYGALYNSYTINTGKLCPLGWHVPNNDEWTTLITYVGGDSIAGDKLREKDTFHWSIGIIIAVGTQHPSNSIGTNESGFTALPCGRRNFNGFFGFTSIITYWWSSTVLSASNDFNWLVGNNWYWYIENDYSGIGSNFDFENKTGFSVRCLKNN